MSTGISMSDLREAFKENNVLVFDKMNDLKTEMANLTNEVKETKEGINTSIINHAVLENDLKNHKEYQMADLAEIKTDLDGIGKRSRSNEKKIVWATGFCGCLALGLKYVI